MKKLFTAIRKGDINTVKALIEKDKELVFCVAKQPPKSACVRLYKIIRVLMNKKARLIFQPCFDFVSI